MFNNTNILKNIIEYEDDTIKEMESFFKNSDSVIGMFLYFKEKELDEFIEFVNAMHFLDMADPDIQKKYIKQFKILFSVLCDNVYFDLNDIMSVLTSPLFNEASEEVFQNAITAKSKRLGLVDIEFKENGEVEVNVDKEKIEEMLSKIRLH